MTLRQLVDCSRRCSERQLPSPPYVSQDECMLYALRNNVLISSNLNLSTPFFLHDHFHIHQEVIATQHGRKNYPSGAGLICAPWWR